MTPRPANDSKFLGQRLVAAFQKGLRRETADPDPPLSERLTEHLERCRRAWPSVTVEETGFAQLLGERCRASSAKQTLDELFVKDLYLVCGCLQNDKAALRALEELIAQARASLERMPNLAPVMDEAAQVFRERVLMSKGGFCKLADYAGRGSLVSWIRASLVRAALNVKRKHPREVLIENDLIERVLPVSNRNPEISYVMTRYRREFDLAFEAAVESLPARSRNVLRLHFCDGLTLEQIGRSYRVNRSTVSRWITTTTADILKETRRVLGNRLRISWSEVDSLIRSLSSQLNVSIESVLRRTPN